jgi:hypothetical protein
MKKLIKSTHLRDNGDSTSTYSCELKRSDITMREFVDAITRSINHDHDSEFNEWWASCTITDYSTMAELASFTLYSPNLPVDVEMGGSKSTIPEILEKYGDYIVKFCRWNGGWGSGHYYIRVQKGEKMNASEAD